MSNSPLQQCDKLIREKNGIIDIPPLSTVLCIEHWLPLCKGDILLHTSGQICKDFGVTEDGYIGVCLVHNKYDLSKPFNEQSEAFYIWLASEL